MMTLARWMLSIAATCGCATTLSAYPFITHSDFLREKKLRIYLVKPGQNGVLLPIGPTSDERLPPSNAMFLLGHEGTAYRLTGNPNIKSGVWDNGCGQEIDVASLSFADKVRAKGDMIVIGERAETLVKWVPARVEPKEKLPGCFAPRKGYELRSYQTYGFGPSNKQKIYFAEWEATPEASDTVQSARCGIGAIESVGTVSADGNLCNELNALMRDCFGLPIDRQGHSTREFEGSLVFGDDAERWLIFQSTDYESSGHTAIPFIEGKPVDPVKIDEVHDTGC